MTLGPRTQERLIALLKGRTTAGELAEWLGGCPAAVCRALRRMARDGLCVRVSSGPPEAQRWRLTAAGVLVAQGLSAAGGG